MTKYLYGASIQGIQSFIFQTNKLKDIVGASLLVEEACTTLFEKDFTKKDSEGKFIDGEQIIGAAGNIKFIFHKKEDCKRAVLLFPKRVMELAPGITISQAVVQLKEKLEENHSENRKSDLDELEKLLHAQRNKQSKSLLYGQMCMKRSGETGLPLRVRVNEETHKVELLDEGCIAKLNVVEHSKEGQVSLYKKLYDKSVKYFDNLDVSNMTGDNNWLAIIHADGNGLGQVVAKIGKDGSYEGREITLSEFSKRLNQATIGAAQKACEAVDGFDGKNLWIRPVVIGGDDLTVICRADKAIPFVREYLKAFEENTEEKIGHLSACAGIAFIKSSYPFYYGYELAEMLCGEAKKDAKSEEMKKANGNKIPSCLMFHKVQSSFVEDYETIKKKELTPCVGHSFCFGPYYLREQTDRWTIDQLVGKAEELAKEENNPVKTAIREWMTLLKEGTKKAEQKAKRVDALYEGAKKKLFDDAINKDKTQCGAESENETKADKSATEPKDEGKIHRHPAYDILALLTINTQITK